MRAIGRGLKAFYVKAYTDNLTGLAGMVAYSLLLSIFPVALVALFVAGQVLVVAGAHAVRAAGPAGAVPERHRGDAVATRCARSAARPRPSASSPSSPASGSRTSFWGALDTAFCRIYGVPCRTWVRQKLFGLGMLGLVLLFFAATVACRRAQSLLLARSPDLPFGLSGRDALWAISLGAGLVITFGALCDDLPHRAEHAGRAGSASGRARSGRRSRSCMRRLRLPVLPHERLDASAACGTTLVFILIVLLWFYILALIILGGAVVNELRLLRHRDDTLAAMPDPDDRGLRLEQIERERKEHARAEAAPDEPETEQHERRAERAGYLREKLKRAR